MKSKHQQRKSESLQYGRNERFSVVSDAGRIDLEDEEVIPGETDHSAVSVKLQGERIHNLQSALVDNLGEGILLADRSGKIIYANAALAQLLETKRSSLYGENVRKVLKSSPPGKMSAFLRHNKNNAHQDEFLICSLTGVVSAVTVSAISLHLAGRPVTALVFAKDRSRVHFKKLLQESKRTIKKQEAILKKADDDLNALSFVSGHHLQEPLRKIKSFVNYILDREAEHLSDLGREYFDRLYRTAQRMQTLISDLQAFLNVRNVNVSREPIDLNALLKEVLKKFRDDLDKKKISVKLGILPCICIDPFQIEQLFSHLISNSIKYAGNAGSSRITVDSRKIRGISDRFLRPEIKYYRVTFKDNGIGFDARYAEKIFEMFQRLHTGDEYTGTGIGLSICRRVAENHGGKLFATGDADKGACFTIYLPEHPEKIKL